MVSEFEHRRAVYIQHSPIFRFPDIVTVEFVALGPERSSVAVYSRSRYGGYDFAENRKRVKRWLFQLEEVAHPAVSSQGDGIRGETGFAPQSDPYWLPVREVTRTSETGATVWLEIRRPRPRLQHQSAADDEQNA